MGPFLAHRHTPRTSTPHHTPPIQNYPPKTNPPPQPTQPSPNFKAMDIASDLCVYTNKNYVTETLDISAAAKAAAEEAEAGK